MSEIKVASRYAKSLLDLALEQNALEEIKSDAQFFVDTLKTNTVLQAVLKNPIIPLGKKNAITKEIFAAKVNKTTAAFLKIVIDKGRAAILYTIAKEFLNQYNVFKKIFKAQVISATPLTQDSINKIIAVVKDAVKGDVVLTTLVDPNLIGGFILTVGDKQFDASIASSLAKLKKEFAQGITTL
jgi:F-type H+-transporting ATPase subunit delta